MNVLGASFITSLNISKEKTKLIIISYINGKGHDFISMVIVKVIFLPGIHYNYFFTDFYALN